MAQTHFSFWERTDLQSPLRCRLRMCYFLLFSHVLKLRDSDKRGQTRAQSLTVPGLVKSTLRARLCRIWLLKRRTQTLCRYSGVICGRTEDGGG